MSKLTFAGVAAILLLLLFGLVEGYASYKKHVKMGLVKPGVCFLSSDLPSWEKEKVENYVQVLKVENRHVLIRFVILEEELIVEETTIDISELLTSDVVTCPEEFPLEMVGN